MLALDDLITKFCNAMPTRVAEATEHWLEFEQGKAGSLAVLRRLLHTLKGEALMLDLAHCGELAELAESLVDALLRVGQPTALTGDTLLGAFEGMAMLASAQEENGELPPLDPLLEQLRAAIAELTALAASGGAPAPDVAGKRSEHESNGSPAERRQLQSAVKAEVLRPLIHEMRRLHAEQTVFHERLRDTQRMLRALLVEIDPRQSPAELAERITKTLGYGAEIDRRLNRVRAEWSSNDFALDLALDELDGVVRRASVVSTDRLLKQVVRVGRSTSRTLGKDVEIRVSGDAILDAAIEERLEPSLLHVIRNALDHGIEQPEVRRQRGKAPRGTIEVVIKQTESSVHVEIVDDGGGVDTHRLRAVLADRVADVDALSDEELLPYLLEQGVTTSEKVTSISGRGVGLDVVAREVAAAGGQIRIQSSPGVGTRVLLDLPTTLRGEIAVPLRCGTDLFAVPSRAVHSLTRIEELEQTGEGLFLRLKRDDGSQLVRLFSLGTLNGTESPPKVGAPAIVLYRSAGLFALAVDGYDNPRPITLHRTEELAFRSSLVRGVSPMPDGGVLLLLDVDAAFAFARTRDSPVLGRAKRPSGAPRALVVEDAPVARELLCGILRTLGLEVAEATDGRQGLQMARSHPPDIVITDVEMPYMDGIDMVREFKASAPLAQIPVIVLTTAATRKNRERLEELGVTALLSKQKFIEQDLRTVVERCLAERNERADRNDR